ncbi:uncharacterized protein LOC112539558 [Tetranychus urticae]|uniref:uncharacterized protein LOC112539558 n=1 Tax=Tetranychus urticae TaxID=32264 RepID=UPI000D649F3B|nr:uncharacterized protein LOC112539558 [Tetranychus urticae]
MSLLCVNVRRARLIGPDAAQYSTYVTLKLQNVKSTTVTVKGSNPNWEQDFLFETNRLDTGLIVELWNKGLLWDKLLGCHWIPLTIIPMAAEAMDDGQWLSLDGEFIIEEGEVCGTHTPTGHYILIEAHFEPPFEYTIEDVTEFSRNLDLLNNYTDQEKTNWQPENRDPSMVMQQYSLYSGLSEDSDYTSDVSYPIQQQHPNYSSHHANAGASQYGGYPHLSKWAKEYDEGNNAMASTSLMTSSNQLPQLQTDASSSTTTVPLGSSTSNQHQHATSIRGSSTSSTQIPGSRKLPKPFKKQLSDENEPLSYNSRPHRKLPNLHDKPNRLPLMRQITQENSNLNQQQYQNDDSMTITSDSKGISTPSGFNQFGSPSVSGRTRRQQPAIPRKRSLERQGGFEQYEDTSSHGSQIGSGMSRPISNNHLDQAVGGPTTSSTPKKLPQISQIVQRSLPEMPSVPPFDKNKLYNFYEQETARQDSYESYATSIGTESEMNEDWMSRSDTMDANYDESGQLQCVNEGYEQDNWTSVDTQGNYQSLDIDTGLSQSSEHHLQHSSSSAPMISTGTSANQSSGMVNTVASKVTNLIGGMVNAVSSGHSRGDSLDSSNLMRSQPSIDTYEPSESSSAFGRYSQESNSIDDSRNGANSANGMMINDQRCYIDPKEQWKNSIQSDSMIWQTVSEDDNYEDTLQDINTYYNQSTEKEEISPPYLTPEASIDMDNVRDSVSLMEPTTTTTTLSSSSNLLNTNTNSNLNTTSSSSSNLILLPNYQTQTTTGLEAGISSDPSQMSFNSVPTGELASSINMPVTFPSISNTLASSIGSQQTSINLPPSMIPPSASVVITSQPPPSALKSESRAQSEPKTVTFSDQIQEETFSSERGSTIDSSGLGSASIIDINETTELKDSSDISGLPFTPHASNETNFINEPKSAFYEFAPTNTSGMSKARLRWLTAYNKIVSDYDLTKH